MDITPQDNTATQSISDDQELAKALAGVLPDDPNQPAGTPAASGLQFEETAAPVPPVDPTTLDEITLPPVEPEVPVFELPSVPSDSTDNNLDGVKTEALNELRPLLDRVDLPAEEKFDTYLMLIRSTDDATLIEPAHTAAQGITDEKRKAEALLDIIKEIDYLTRRDQPAA